MARLLRALGFSLGGTPRPFVIGFRVRAGQNVAPGQTTLVGHLSEGSDMKCKCHCEKCSKCPW